MKIPHSLTVRVLTSPRQHLVPAPSTGSRAPPDPNPPPLTNHKQPPQATTHNTNHPCIIPYLIFNSNSAANFFFKFSLLNASNSS